MSFHRLNPNVPSFLLAAVLALHVPMAGVVFPARPAASVGLWAWIQEILPGWSEPKADSLTANPNRGPLIDPDGGSAARRAAPRAV